MDIRKRCGIFAVQLSKKVMEYKVCKNCGRTLPLSEFIGVRGREVVKCSYCRASNKRSDTNRRSLISIYHKAYRKSHKEELSLKSKVYREENKERISEKKKEYALNNKDKILQHGREYREAHKEEIKLRKQSYYYANWDRIRLGRKEYYEANKQEILSKQIVFYNDNRERILLQHKDYRDRNKDALNLQKRLSYQKLPDYIFISELKNQGFDTKDITPDLIELKRAIRKLNKLINSHENETN